VQDYLGIADSPGVAATWPKFRFDMGLSAVLVAMMTQDQETLSLAARDLTPAETSQINFLQSFYPQALRRINDRLVTYE
jgi:hypothetical protein